MRWPPRMVRAIQATDEGWPTISAANATSSRPTSSLSGKRLGPNLVERVRDPEITELALRSYLQTTHPVMPNIMLNQEQADDIIAYLLTFKESAR